MDGELTGGPESIRILRPSLTTRFHIDYEWWTRSEREWRVYLLSHLCSQHRAELESVPADALIDWVDPATAEVRRIDGIQNALVSHCSLQPEYISQQTTLVDAVFRVFLANGNSPLSVHEISQKINRPANTILKTLAGTRVYKGLRPVSE